MRFDNSSVRPLSLLYIERTGGGKSLVCDVFSVMFCGVSLTIVPILALGADQKSKVDRRAV